MTLKLQRGSLNPWPRTWWSRMRTPLNRLWFLTAFIIRLKSPFSDRALLVQFLMLCLKWWVVPRPPQEVIIVDVVYPVVIFAHDRSLSLLSAMVGCLQSWLRTLCQSLCNVVVEKDTEGNVVVGPDGGPRVRTPNLRVELPYTYLMAWYVMHCPSLLSAVQSFEDSMPFVQRLNELHRILGRLRC